MTDTELAKKLTPQYNEQSNCEIRPDMSLYLPAASEDTSFPVSINTINLSERYMYMFPWHWHDEIEFTLVKAGQINLKLSNKSYLLNPGDGFFINQNRLHSFRAVAAEDSIVEVFKFHPSFIFGYTNTGLIAKYLIPLLSSDLLHCLIFSQNDPETCEIYQLVKEAFTLCAEKKYGYELLVKSTLCRLLNLLLSYNKTSSDSVSHFSAQAVTDSARVKQALLFIKENHAEPLTLEEIADSIHLSKSECCRCFQRCLGVSPFEYLMKFRIFESIRKINRGEEVAKSISALASSVGFNSASYYNKLFKKYVNCTPSEYKKNLQKNKQCPTN